MVVHGALFRKAMNEFKFKYFKCIYMKHSINKFEKKVVMHGYVFQYAVKCLLYKLICPLPINIIKLFNLFLHYNSFNFKDTEIEFLDNFFELKKYF